MLNIGKELAGLKENQATPKYELSKFQKNFLLRDIKDTPNDELWTEAQQLKEMATVSFLELGRRLHELKNRYANNKNGSFQKKYIQKGLKKTQVETLISKYEMYSDMKNNIGCDATDIILISEKIENLSQRNTAKLKKATEETKDKFFKGEIKASEIMEAEIVEPEDIGCTATDMSKARKKLMKEKEKYEKKIEAINKKLEEIERDI